MENYLKNYFRTEKQLSLFIAIFGIITSALSIYGWFYSQHPVFEAAALPLFFIGIIQMAAGGTIFFRTDKQVRQLLSLLQQGPEKLAASEIPRMEKVSKNFKNYRLLHMILFLIGFTLTLMGGIANWGSTALGSGVGLIIQSALMLVVDLFAGWQGDLYLHKLRKIS